MKKWDEELAAVRGDILCILDNNRELIDANEKPLIANLVRSKLIRVLVPLYEYPSFELRNTNNLSILRAPP